MKIDPKNKQFNRIQKKSRFYLNQEKLSTVINWEVVPLAVEGILGKLLFINDGWLARVFTQVSGVC